MPILRFSTQTYLALVNTGIIDANGTMVGDRVYQVDIPDDRMDAVRGFDMTRQQPAQTRRPGELMDGDIYTGEAPAREGTVRTAPIEHDAFYDDEDHDYGDDAIDEDPRELAGDIPAEEGGEFLNGALGETIPTQQVRTPTPPPAADRQLGRVDIDTMLADANGLDNETAASAAISAIGADPTIVNLYTEIQNMEQRLIAKNAELGQRSGRRGMNNVLQYIEAINSLPTTCEGVASAKVIEGDLIAIKYSRIIARDRQGRQWLIGDIIVTMKFSSFIDHTRDLGLKFYNMTYESWHAIAGHVRNSPDNYCLGTYASGISGAVRDGDIVSLTTVLKMYLEYVNIDDTYGAHITEFRRAEEVVQ